MNQCFLSSTAGCSDFAVPGYLVHIHFHRFIARVHTPTSSSPPHRTMFPSNNQTAFNPTKKLHINASTPNHSQIATCKLFVGNLATHTTGAHLQAIFHSYGQVIECVKVRERYGFVRFASGEDAQRALMTCNGIQLNGYPMIVEYAQNEILISPQSPRTISAGATASFRPHPYHAGRSSMGYQVRGILVIAKGHLARVSG